MKTVNFPNITIVNNHKPMNCGIRHCAERIMGDKPYFVITRKDGKQFSVCKECASKYAIKEGMFDQIIGEEIMVTIPRKEELEVDTNHGIISGECIKLTFEYIIPFEKIKESYIEEFSNGCVEGLTIVKKELVTIIPETPIPVPINKEDLAGNYGIEYPTKEC